jgi:hypothetical protein
MTAWPLLRGEQQLARAGIEAKAVQGTSASPKQADEES